jgi:hypothetical protein
MSPSLDFMQTFHVEQWERIAMSWKPSSRVDLTTMSAESTKQRGSSTPMP